MRWVLVLSLAATLHAEQEEKLLPVDRTRILNERGVRYVVDGRMTIPWGCEISIARDVEIVGRGENPELVVEGSLQIHGTENERVVLSDLVLRPAARFEAIRLDSATFRGSGGVRNPKEEPAAGSIEIENSCLGRGTALDVVMGKGQVVLTRAEFYEPVRITGVVPDGARRNSLDVRITSCARARGGRSRPGGTQRPCEGFVAGLFVEGVNDVLVRNSRLRGEKTEFRNCYAVTFDGNRVDSTRVEFHQESFAKTKLQKCDFFCQTLVLKTAARFRKQRVLIDKCWFRDLTRPGEIEEQIIVDGKDDDQCGAVAMFRQIKKQRLSLAE